MAIFDAAEVTVTIAGVTITPGDFATDDRTTVYASDPFSVACRSEVAIAGTLPEVVAAGAVCQRRDKTELHALLLVLCESYREMGKAYAASRAICLAGDERSDPASARAFGRSSLISLVLADYIEDLASRVLCQDYEEEAQKLYRSFVNREADGPDPECAKLLAKAEEAEARLHRCEAQGGIDHAGVHWAKTPESERSRSVHDSVSWTVTWGVGGAAR